MAQGPAYGPLISIHACVRLCHAHTKTTEEPCMALLDAQIVSRTRLESKTPGTRTSCLNELQHNEH